MKVSKNKFFHNICIILNAFWGLRQKIYEYIGGKKKAPVIPVLNKLTEAFGNYVR